MDPLGRLCARLSRRRLTERTLARAVPALGLGLIAAGTAIAVVRLAWADGDWLVGPLLALGMLPPLVLLPRLLARRDPAWATAASIDRLAGAQGLAMALAAIPVAQRDASWNQRLEAQLAGVSLPAIRLHGLATLLLGTAILIGAWLLPQLQATPVLPPLPGSALREAANRLQELTDQQLAPEAVLRELAERLAALQQAVAGQGLDQQTWAALDALEHDLSASQTQAAARLSEALSKAEALAGLDAGKAGDGAAQAAQDLAVALAELRAQAPGLAAGLPGQEMEALLRLAGDAQLTPAQLQALQRGGANPAAAGQGQRPGDAAAARQLADRLAAQLAQRLAAGGFSSEDSGQPGGPGPGGGHAPLTWGDGQRVEGGFRDRLASGVPVQPEAGVKLGERARAPRSDEQATDAPARAAPQAQTATAADARRARVAPRLRAAVEGYFTAADPAILVPTGPVAPAPTLEQLP